MSANAEKLLGQAANRTRNAGEAASLQGYIDAIEPDRIYGWAWNSSDPSERLSVEIRQGEQLIVRLEASQPRPDLVANGIGDGRYAFIANIPAIAEIDRASPVSVVAMTADGGAELELRRQSPQEGGGRGNSIGPVSAAVLGEIRARDQRLQGQLRQLVSVAQERGDLDQEMHDRLNHALARLDLALPEIERRVGALEVFELRFETLLQKTDKRLGSMEALLKPRQPWLLRLWALLATIAAFGLVAHHLLRGA